MGIIKLINVIKYSHNIKEIKLKIYEMEKKFQSLEEFLINNIFNWFMVIGV